MTLWKQGRPLFPFLPGFGSFVDPPAVGIGGVLPIGTVLVTEFAPTMIVMGIVGRSAGGPWPASLPRKFMSIYGSRARDRPARAAGAPSRPNRFAPRHVARHKSALSAPPDPKMIRSRARTGTAVAPCFQFQSVVSLFSLCYLVLQKLSKSLIPLSDCPFALNRLPVFLGKSPCFRGKNRGWRELLDRGRHFGLPSLPMLPHKRC